MSENHIQRRDVLKTVGTASTLGVVGTVHAARSNEGAVRLVEMGMKYDLPDGYNYQRVHVEGKSPYHVDGNSVIVDSVAPNEVQNAFIDNDVVVNGVGRASLAPETQTTGTVQAVPTELAAREDPYELTHLTESHRLPDVRVKVAGENPTVLVEGIRQTLTPGAERELELPARTISAETYTVTDEIAEIEGVPEHMWGPKTEYDSVAVEAVPRVTVRDRGEFDLLA